MLGLMWTSMLCVIAAQADVPRAGARPKLPNLDVTVSELAPDGRRLAIAALADRVLVLDVASGEIESVCPIQRGAPVAVAWRADGDRLAVLDSQGGASVFDPADGFVRFRKQCSPAMPGEQFVDLRALKFLAASDELLVGFGSLVEIVRGENGQTSTRIEPDETGVLSAVAVSPDGSLVAIGNSRGGVGAWSTRTGELVHGPIGVPRGTRLFGVHALDFDPSGRRVAIGAGDDVARIWTLDGSAPMREFSHRETNYFGDLAIGDVRFSPDGLRLAASSFVWWETRLWDVATG